MKGIKDIWWLDREVYKGIRSNYSRIRSNYRRIKSNYKGNMCLIWKKI